MLIYTNENNPATLKLLIAAKISGQNIDLKIVTPNDRSVHDPKHLPCLEIDLDTSICTPNAAAWFLWQPQTSNSEKINEWLEWESHVLAPALTYAIGGNVKSDKIKSTVSQSMKKIDQCLEKSTFLLVDQKISLCDVIIWSTLYPLLKDDALLKEYQISNFPNVLKWFNFVEENEHVKQSVSLYKPSGSKAFQALLSGARYLPLTHSTEVSSNTQSPQSPVEAITKEELEAAAKEWEKDESHIPKLTPQSKTILPTPKSKNIFITSALPYVNNVPHLGNIIGCVLSADVFARFSRICNYNTLFIAGTDEYGTATETKALEEGLSCRAICDKYFSIHKDIYDWFNISFDYFGRTSSPEQTEVCQDLFLQLNSNGFMFTEAVEQLHCENCDRYLADRFVEGGCPHPGCNYEDARGDQCDGCGKLINAVELKNPRCKICRNSPKLKISTQFFIDLPKLEPLLLHWMKKSAPGWSNNAQVIAKSWLRDGLKPRCITRDLKWGVPVPLKDYKDKVFYVWFDAPIGYMSISKAYTEKWEEWWRPKPNVDITLYQFMAKDNVPFHSVMFPACLLGANRGYTLVSHLMATEYLNYEDGKFSKSRGVGVFGNDARNTGIPSDIWRFYLLYLRPESQDSNFSWADLGIKNNSELLNNLGNFINRALVFAKNNFNKTVPQMELTKDDFNLLALCTRELKNYVACLEKCKLRDGIRHILSISRHGNQYMQANQPWVLLKGSAEDKIRAGTVIGVSCNVACLLAILLHPYMPETSANLKKQLNIPDFALDPENARIPCYLRAGHKLGEPSPLFAKLEAAKVEELKQKFAGSQNGVQTASNEKVNGIETSDVIDVKAIEEEVAKQGMVVRKLKESGANKSVWQPEVTKLLELKSKLASASGAPAAKPQKGSKKSKK